MYEPKAYWSVAGKGYRAKSERVDELVNLERCVQKCVPAQESILEVGAGNGRLYQFLQERNPEIEGRFKMCDFVDSFRQACHRNTGILPTKWDGKRLPYADGEFQLVISFSVLLHVPTSDIAEIIKEHARVAKRHLFVATWFERGDDWASHNAYFRHDYPTLFAKSGLHIIDDMKCNNLRRANWLLEKIDAKL